MTGRQFQPGDVAMVELPLGGERAGVLVDDDGDRCWHVGSRHGAGLLCLAADAVAARPLVVIDPEDRQQITRLYKLYASAEPDGALLATDFLQAALREFANPTSTKPAEPTGLGAVVVDRDGYYWIYTGQRGIDDGRWWMCGTTNKRKYDALDVTEVLSEGVTP